MKRIVILLFVLTFCVFGQAQEKNMYSVSGTVVHCKTGEPCIMQTVQLFFLDSSQAFYSPSTGHKKYYVTYSDSLGHFRFPSVEEGEYLIGKRSASLSPNLPKISLTADMVVDTFYYVGEYYPAITQDYLTNPEFAPIAITSHNMAVFSQLAKVCKENVKYDYKKECFEKKDMESVMAVLPLIRIPDTMEVDLYRFGGDEGWTSQPYIRSRLAHNEVEMSYGFKWSDSLTKEENQIRSRQAWEEYNDFLTKYKYSPNDKLVGYIPISIKPTPFEYIEVPFNEAGIWQAYLFYKLEKFLPRYWHELYSSATLIMDREALKFIYPQEGRCSRAEEYPDFTQHIMDSVSTINNRVEILSSEKALITTTWWYVHYGLIETYDYAIREGGHIRFEEAAKSKVLFEWELPIMY